MSRVTADVTVLTATHRCALCFSPRPDGISAMFLKLPPRASSKLTPKSTLLIIEFTIQVCPIPSGFLDLQ